MTTLTPTRLAALPRVNLLPPEIAAAAKLRRLKAMLAILVVGALVVVGLLYFLASGQVSGAQDDLTQAQAQNALLQKQTVEYAEVPEVQSELATSRANLETAMTPEIRWSFFLNDLSLTIPKTTRVATMTAVNDAAAAQMTGLLTPTTTSMGTPTMGSIEFTGTAVNYDAVVAWLQSLAKEPGYSEPKVTSVAPSDDEATQGHFFDMESGVSLDGGAASNRYLQIANGE